MYTTALSASWASVAALLAAAPAPVQEVSIPSVVVTVENAQPSRGAFLTPPWLGMHDGTFDVFDVGRPASAVLGGDELERLAEDGVNTPLATAFDSLTGGAPQVEMLPGPSGPLAPGDRASVTVNVPDPAVQRWFSFASMVIPSNDTFLGNDDPRAYEVFDDAGRFVAKPILVTGADSRDAGTEVNDEIAGNVAFLGQTMPNTGTPENGVVLAPSPGFTEGGMLAFPNGVRNYPVFAQAAVGDPDDRLLLVTFREVDLGGQVLFTSRLSPEEEVQATLVQSEARGRADVVSLNAETLSVEVRFQGLTGPLQGAHLHLAPEGSAGPIVLDLTPGIGEGRIRFTASAEDLTGPLAGEEMLALVDEIAAGNVYVNLHTAEYPSGELRGQVLLRPGVDETARVER